MGIHRVNRTLDLDSGHLPGTEGYLLYFGLLSLDHLTFSQAIKKLEMVWLGFLAAKKQL